VPLCLVVLRWVSHFLLLC